MTRKERLLAGLSSIFGGLALLLAAVGLYGVRAYSVARRIPEIGIRVALGADRGMITKMILRETGWLALLGVPSASRWPTSLLAISNQRSMGSKHTTSLPSPGRPQSWLLLQRSRVLTGSSGRAST